MAKAPPDTSVAAEMAAVAKVFSSFPNDEQNVGGAGLLDHCKTVGFQRN
jgi:hypothetical protein